MHVCMYVCMHAARTPRANRSKKFIIHLNGSSYAFDKTHQPFEQLELSVSSY